MSKRYLPPKYTEEQLQEQSAMLRELAEMAREASEKRQETGTILDIVDYSCECSMCGKPMPYRFCGMCPSCEMVWNS